MTKQNSLDKIFLFHTLAFFLIFCTTGAAHATHSPWYFDLVATLSAGSYQKKSDKKSFTKQNLLFNTDYLEKYSATFNAGTAQYQNKQTSSSWQQTQYAIQAGRHFFSDSLHGKVYFNLLAITITDTSSDWFSYGAGLRYLNYRQTFLAGFNYTQSKYTEDNPEIKTTQLTPRLGVGVFNSNLWLGLKANFISSDATDKNHFAIEPLVVYYPTTAWFFLQPDSIGLGGIIGERIYAVEHETFLVYNTADLQTGSMFTFAHWRMGDSSGLSLSIGRDNFKNQSQIPYSLNYASLTIVKKW